MAYKMVLGSESYLMHFNPFHKGPGPGGGRFDYAPTGWKKRYQYIDRNYQGPLPDGSTGNVRLTKAGEKRYQRDLNANNMKAPNKRADPDTLADPDRWVREDIDSAISATKAVGDMSRATSDLAGRLMKDPPRGERYDLSDMSDAELRAILNREQMERQYNDYFNPQQTNKGREWVQGAATTIGAVATVGLTALQIAQAVKSLRG